MEAAISTRWAVCTGMLTPGTINPGRASLDATSRNGRRSVHPACLLAFCMTWCGVSCVCDGGCARTQQPDSPMPEVTGTCIRTRGAHADEIKSDLHCCPAACAAPAAVPAANAGHASRRSTPSGAAHGPHGTRAGADGHHPQRSQPQETHAQTRARGRRPAPPRPCTLSSMPPSPAREHPPTSDTFPALLLQPSPFSFRRVCKPAVLHRVTMKLLEVS